MAEMKNIKGIEDNLWSEFKSLAAMNKVKAAKMFKILVKEYEKKTVNFWDDIFLHKPILSAKEYADLEKNLKLLRKEHGWRL